MSKKCLPDDEELNTSFAQAVEKHPCLYDNTLKEYSDRNEQDKAWNRIARKFYTTEDECKKSGKYFEVDLQDTLSSVIAKVDALQNQLSHITCGR